MGTTWREAVQSGQASAETGRSGMEMEMEVVLFIAAVVLLIGGIFFAAVGVIGMLRFSDFYPRAQASTCITTLGTVGAVAAGIILAALSSLAAIAYVKLVIIAALIMISGAVASHALAKSTYKRGHRPHGEGFVKDDYKEDGFDGN
ncbi:MAG: monovalent cation/H(+) antiporter subunit G [Eubacteriales bacterium]|nr:monovalent cation/H(+) antiporter subunit G [Eubacteriales bacterium]